jgi:aldehyde dehydrogenase (NAD+)
LRKVKLIVLSAKMRNLTISTVSEATVEDVDAAVAAAKKAQPAWAALSPLERGKPMACLAAMIAEASNELAILEAESMGRTVSSYFDANYAADWFRHFSEASYPQGNSSLNTPGFVNVTVRQPVGVVGVIIPWNVPIVFFGQKLAPALASGNCVVLKSSEKAPLTSIKVATFIEKAGFPPGVINVISGHGPVSGAAIASHMDIRVLSFTGSTRTGRIISKAAADSNLKNVIMELGGKAPAIIFEDADIEHAVKGTEHSIMFLSGQTCMANSRIYVQKSIGEKFIASFQKLVESRKHGDPTETSTTHGPQADAMQHKAVLKYIESGKITGKLAIGDQSSTFGENFVNPVIFLDQPEDSAVVKEEIFGPVVVINTFETEEEAIAKANDSEFGLYAAVYTKDLDRAMRVATKLESGTVGVNCTSPTGANDMPIGGYKGSGYGRESFVHAMDHYLETKAVLIQVAGL